MATRTAENVRSPQKEVVIKAPETGVSAEATENAQIFVDHMVRRLEMQTQDYVRRSAAEIEAGGPQLVGGYQYWNCLTIGPVQFISNPPFLPSKIVAAGEPALMVGLVWVNPALGPGGSLPGTTVLGGRSYRIRFESINLSTVANGPDATFTGMFNSPASVVTAFTWWMPTPDPGVNPALYEVNLTADISLGGQPFAAFSTWHYDLDLEPPFLGLPGMGPQIEHERPARFLIYHQ
jgi:hypothetical protein